MRSSPKHRPPCTHVHLYTSIFSAGGEQWNSWNSCSPPPSGHLAPRPPDAWTDAWTFATLRKPCKHWLWTLVRTVGRFVRGRRGERYSDIPPLVRVSVGLPLPLVPQVPSSPAIDTYLQLSTPIYTKTRRAKHVGKFAETRGHGLTHSSIFSGCTPKLPAPGWVPICSYRQLSALICT